MTPERLTFGPKETARAMGVSDTWLRRAMKLHGLPYSRVGGRILIRRDELLAWLAAHREKQDAGQRHVRLVSEIIGQVQRP